MEELPTVKTPIPVKKILLFSLILLTLPISFLISYLSCNKQKPNTEIPDTNTEETFTTFIPEDGTGTLSLVDNENKEMELIYLDSTTKEERTMELKTASGDLYESPILIGKYLYVIEDSTHIAQIDIFSGEKEVFELDMNPNFVIVSYYVRDNVIYYLSGIEYCTWYCAETWCSCPSIDLQAYDIDTNKTETLAKDMTNSSNYIDGFDENNNLIFSYNVGDAGYYSEIFYQYSLSEKKVSERKSLSDSCFIYDDVWDCGEMKDFIESLDEVIKTVTYKYEILFKNGKIQVSEPNKMDGDEFQKVIRVGTSVSDLQYYYPLWNE